MFPRSVSGFTRVRGFAIFRHMINKDDLDKLRQYLKPNAAKRSRALEWYTINGLEISVDVERCSVFVYLTRDQWLVACTEPICSSNDNPHEVILIDFDWLMRLIKGGEMAYINIMNELVLEELQ